MLINRWFLMGVLVVSEFGFSFWKKRTATQRRNAGATSPAPSREAEDTSAGAETGAAELPARGVAGNDANEIPFTFGSRAATIAADFSLHRSCSAMSSDADGSFTESPPQLPSFQGAFGNIAISFGDSVHRGMTDVLRTSGGSYWMIYSLAGCLPVIENSLRAVALRIPETPSTPITARFLLPDGWQTVGDFPSVKPESDSPAGGTGVKEEECISP